MERMALRSESTVARVPSDPAVRGVVAIVVGVLVQLWPDFRHKARVLLIGAFVVTPSPRAQRVGRDAYAVDVPLTRGWPR
jgi:hypothetical protein